VIEPHWHALHEALCCPREKGVEHIDDVIRLHQEFQDTCECPCVLCVCVSVCLLGWLSPSGVWSCVCVVMIGVEGYVARFLLTLKEHLYVYLSYRPVL
jgi:hypothetical protein